MVRVEHPYTKLDKDSKLYKYQKQKGLAKVDNAEKRLGRHAIAEDLLVQFCLRLGFSSLKIISLLKDGGQISQRNLLSDF